VATRLSLLLGTTFEMDALVPVARWDRLGFGRSWWRPLKHDVLPFRAATLRSDYLRSAIDGALDHSWVAAATYPQCLLGGLCWL